ncbi:XdhC family protein, partial [Lacticaseibacillus paracasei]|uniref:XdhC family protein n=1 Tax=Lacticaseibacillus paracasei TaxID=1597 RepID=UPI0019527DC9
LTVDKQVLSQLLDSPNAYIGVLGPKKRTENMLRQIRESGKQITDPQLKNLHAPIGLDIGAETPDQIALAILAEIHAVSTNRSAGFLRDRTQPIHDTGSIASSENVRQLDAEPGSAIVPPNGSRLLYDTGYT